jgi:hypothetical protein
LREGREADYWPGSGRVPPGFTLGGDTPPLRTAILETRLASVERKIAKREPFEEAHVYNAGGTFLGSRQSRVIGQVDFDPAEWATFRGAVLTHNHPGFGGSLSEHDVWTAIRYDLAEVRAVDAREQKHVYSVRRPGGGWPPVTLDEFVDAFKAIRTEVEAVLGDLDRVSYERALRHEIWETMRRRFGLFYERTALEE